MHAFLGTGSCLLFLLALSMTGCRPAGESESPAFVKREYTWEQRIEGVRAGDFDQVIELDESITHEQFQMLETCREELRHLEIGQAELNAADWELLSRLENLDWLRLDFSVSDMALESIAKLPHLRILNLPDGEFGDAGLAHLTSLRELELLRFHSEAVTDAGLVHVAGLPALRYLHLIQVPITDVGLKALHQARTLESLYLDGGQATDAGLAALLQALPELHLHKDQLHLPEDPHAHEHRK
ncbi:MAG: hypothetical protein KDA76_09575 [Planctomycetaceae bacterium]|nr:hypothetical protein [Planctomycetaceae bacterium]